MAISDRTRTRQDPTESDQNTQFDEHFGHRLGNAFPEGFGTGTDRESYLPSTVALAGRVTSRKPPAPPSTDLGLSALAELS